MFLKKLELRNFRSYKEYSLDIDKPFNFILGPNGSGKTSILEAICFLSDTRSFKKAEDKELINTSSDFAFVKGVYESKEEEHQIEAVIEKKGKTFTIDDVKKKSSIQVIGNLITVSYEPSMVFLFKDEPSGRRKLLDETLSPIDSQYLYSLSRYKKYLKERNQALALNYDPDVINVLTKELIMSSYRIWQMRKRLIEKLDESVNETFKNLDESDIEVHLEYKSTLMKADNLEEYIESMNKAYDAKKSEEATRKITLIGIHRDDVKATLNGLELGSSGSQGQNRLVTIAIKMAIAKLIAEVTKAYPILLLDDIFSDLDNKHLEKLKSEFEKYEGQIFVTGCKEIKNINNWNKILIEEKNERSN